MFRLLAVGVLVVGALNHGWAQGSVTPDSNWVTQPMLQYVLPSDVLRLDARETRSGGLDVSAYQGLEELHFGNSSFTGLPLSVGQLPKLRRLHLDRTWNLNHEQALLQLQTLPQLEHLSLHYCNLRSIPASVAGLQQLRSLNLELNALTAIGPELARLPHLRALYLGLNSGLASFPLVLLQMPQLEVLYLDRTPIRVLPPTIPQLANLHTLGLGGTSLRALPPQLAQMPRLQSLDISHCDTLDWRTALPIIAKCSSLRRLSLNHTDLRQAPTVTPGTLRLDTLQAALCIGGVERLLPALSASRSLRYLDVSRTRIDTVLLKQLLRLETLEYLDVSSLDLKTLPEEIQYLRNLHTLVVQYNDLPVSELQKLRLLPKLAVLRVSFSKYSEAELTELQQALPSVSIGF